MSRWLRDIDVHLKSSPPLRAPGSGGFVTCGCFIETYLATIYRQIRTPCTVKVNIELNADVTEPWISPDVRSQISDCATVRWPVDIARLKDANALQWIQIHFEEMHSAMLHIASIRGWPLAPLAAAREAVIKSNYRFTGLHKNQFTSPDQKYKLQLRYDMDWEWFVIEGILVDAEYLELGRKEIARYPAISGPLHQFMRGKCRWKSNHEFVFISSDNWFEPRQASISLEDFGLRAQ